MSEANERLDRLVAEHVMGLKPGVDFGEWPEHDWQRDEDGEINMGAWDGDQHSGPQCVRCGESYCRWCTADEGMAKLHKGPCRKAPPSYHAKIWAAWEVVERLRAAGWLCQLWHGHAGLGFRESTDDWECRFARDKEAAMYSQASNHSATAPETICRAALAAVGVEVSDRE